MFGAEIASQNFFSPSAYTYTAGITADTTVLALFQARTAAITSQHFPASSIPNSINPGPYIRKLSSVSGGTVKCDTALETGITLTLVAGAAITDTLICKLYQTGSTVVDLLVQM